MPEKQSFKITGMTCTTCAKNVERALNKIDGVEYASVNLATERGFVASEREIDMEAIKKAVNSAGYDISAENGESDSKAEFIKKRNNLLLSLAATVPLSVMMILHMLNFHVPLYDYFEIAVGSFVIFWTGRNSFKSTWIALKHFHTNMDTLIVFGSSAAILTSALKAAGLDINSFGAIGAMIVAIHLTGKFIESFLKNKAAKEIKSLIGIQSKNARLLKDGKILLVPTDSLRTDDRISVLPGERIPADGLVLDGKTSVDESMISGESLPVEKNTGSEIIGGSMNLTGHIEARVTRTGKDSFLQKMIDLIETAQGSKIPIQALADRITVWFVPIIISLSVLSGVFWFFNYEGMHTFLATAQSVFPWIPLNSDPLSFSIFAMVSTIVIACPCALGLATPMALISGTSAAAKKGLLIRNAEAIQTAKNIDVVIMDKTGTLTQGKPAVKFTDLSGDILIKCGRIEENSSHPLAKSIVEYSRLHSGDLYDFKFEIENITEESGNGIKCVINGFEYFIGKPEKTVPEYCAQLESGSTVVELRINGIRTGYFVIEDQLRESTADAVSSMKKRGYIPVMATGDNEKTARYIASRAGIDTVYAGVTPERKLEIINEFQKKGKKVLMAGDGMNDAAALRGADVGMAIGSGTDLAIDNADIIIVSGGIEKILDAMEISSKTFKVIVQNLFWAFIYNIVAIPAAFLGLLHPSIAESAMALSSITVILNSMRIKNMGKEVKKMTLKKYHVPDMSCKHCEMRIAKIFREYGVNNFRINLEKKEIEFESTEEKSIIQRLEDEGYPVSKTE